MENQKQPTHKISGRQETKVQVLYSNYCVHDVQHLLKHQLRKLSGTNGCLGTGQTFEVTARLGSPCFPHFSLCICPNVTHMVRKRVSGTRVNEVMFPEVIFTSPEMELTILGNSVLVGNPNPHHIHFVIVCLLLLRANNLIGTAELNEWGVNSRNALIFKSMITE